MKAERVAVALFLTVVFLAGPAAVLSQPTIPTVDSAEPAEPPAVAGEAAAAPVASDPGSTCAITVPTSLLPVARTLANEFRRTHPDQEVIVRQSPTAGGIGDLRTGEAEIVALSRPASEAEHRLLQRDRQADLIAIPVARSPILFYVHPDNELTEIDYDTLRRIFRGELNYWGPEDWDIGDRIPIVRAAPDLMEGKQAAVERHLLGGKSCNPPEHLVATTQEVINAASEDLRVIGIGGPGDAWAGRPLAVKPDGAAEAIKPDRTNLLDGTYPLSHYTYWCFAGSPTGTAREFLKFTLSRAGQRVLAAHKEWTLVPLRWAD
jgi:phosphate transport system substrate-binding protein